MMHKKESQIRTNSTIHCCEHCVPPKRHTACWGHCPEYLKEKADYEARKAAYYGNTAVNAGITFQRTANITKALKARKNKFRRAGKERFNT